MGKRMDLHRSSFDSRSKRIQFSMQKRASNYRIVLFARTGPLRGRVLRFAHGSSVTVVCRGKPSVNLFFPGPSLPTSLRPRLSTLENRLPTLRKRGGLLRKKLLSREATATSRRRRSWASSSPRVDNKCRAIASVSSS